MKESLVEQLIRAHATSMYDEKSRRLWIKAMRVTGMDEATIIRVYQNRFPRDNGEVIRS